MLLKRWCASLVDKKGRYIKKSRMWRYCDSSCPVNNSESCHQKNRVPRFKLEQNKYKQTPKGKQMEDVKTKTCQTKNTVTFIEDKNEPDGFRMHELKNPPNCIFPFHYRGNWHSECIHIDDHWCRFWCSVKNDHGYHRK